jgi:hypothetical protein
MFIKKSVLALDLVRQILMIYGPAGIGKTTFMSHRPNCLWLVTEPGINFSQVDVAADTDIGWNMENVLNWISDMNNNPQNYKNYDTVVVDTADGLSHKCIAHVLNKNEKEYMADIPHGKGWDQLSSILNIIIGGILSAGKTICFTNHSDVITSRFSTGEKAKTEPRLNKRAREAIINRVDFMGYMTIGTVGVDEKGKALKGRLIDFRPTEDLDAKNRGGVFDKPVCIEPVEECYAKFVEAYENGLEKFKENIDG